MSSALEQMASGGALAESLELLGAALEAVSSGAVSDSALDGAFGLHSRLQASLDQLQAEEEPPAAQLAFFRAAEERLTSLASSLSAAAPETDSLDCSAGSLARRIFLAGAICHSVLGALSPASSPTLCRQLGAALVYRLAVACQGVLDAAVRAIHCAVPLTASPASGSPEELKGLAVRLGQLGGAVLSLTHGILSLAYFHSRDLPPEGLAHGRAVRATLCRPERVRVQLEAGICALHAAHTAGAGSGTRYLGAPFPLWQTLESLFCHLQNSDWCKGGLPGGTAAGELVALVQRRAEELWAARPDSTAGAGECAAWLKEWEVGVGILPAARTVVWGATFPTFLSLQTSATLWVLQQWTHDVAPTALETMRHWLLTLTRVCLAGAGATRKRADARPSAPTQLVLCLEAAGVAAAATMAGGLETKAVAELGGKLFPQLIKTMQLPAGSWQGIAGVDGALASVLGAAEALVRLAAQLAQQLGQQGGAAGSTQLACFNCCLEAANTILELVDGQLLGKAAAEADIEAALCLAASLGKLAAVLAGLPAEQLRLAAVLAVLPAEQSRLAAGEGGWRGLCSRTAGYAASGVAVCATSVFAETAALGDRWRDAALLTVLDAVRSITELPPPVGEDTIACLNNVLAALGQLPEWGAGLVEAAGAPALLAAVLLPPLDLPPPLDLGPESSAQLLAEPLRALSCSASMHSGVAAALASGGCLERLAGWAARMAAAHKGSPQLALVLEPARNLLATALATVAGGTGRSTAQADCLRLSSQLRGLAKKQLRSRAAWEQAQRELQHCAGPAGAARRAALAAEEAEERQWAELELRAARARALRPCANPRCANVRGASEARLQGRRCGGCGVARFCSEACAREAWGEHSAVCARLRGVEGAC